MVSSNFWGEKYVVTIHMALPDYSWSSCSFQGSQLGRPSPFLSAPKCVCLSLSTYTYTAQCLKCLNPPKDQVSTFAVLSSSHFCSHVGFLMLLSWTCTCQLQCCNNGIFSWEATSIGMRIISPTPCPNPCFLTFSLYCGNIGLSE